MKRLQMALPLALLAALAGCVSGVLGGGKPVQLYRLDHMATDPPVAPPIPTKRVVVALETVRFAPGIDGDRVLAVRGQQLLYLKDVRWVANAYELFGQALRGSVARRAPALLLTDDRAAAAATLQVSVNRFEAVYEDRTDQGAPPVIRIEADARLIARDRSIIGEQRLAAAVVASDNRAGPIIEAFSTASDEVVGKLAEWSQANLTAR